MILPVTVAVPDSAYSCWIWDPDTGTCLTSRWWRFLFADARKNKSSRERQGNPNPPSNEYKKLPRDEERKPRPGECMDVFPGINQLLSTLKQHTQRAQRTEINIRMQSSTESQFPKLLANSMEKAHNSRPTMSRQIRATHRPTNSLINVTIPVILANVSVLVP